MSVWPFALLFLAALAGYLAWWWRNGRKKGPADTQPVVKPNPFPRVEEIFVPPAKPKSGSFTPLADLLAKEEAAKPFKDETALQPPPVTEPPKSTRRMNRRIVPDRRKH